MSEKLSQKQADALRHLSRFPESGFPFMRYTTAQSLVRHGLAEFTRNTYFPRKGRPWEATTQRDWAVRITDQGKAVVSHWAATNRWLRMTGAAR